MQKWIDTNLIPPGTQYGATQGKSGKEVILDMGICKPAQTSATS
jgi:hypothetical protein